MEHFEGDYAEYSLWTVCRYQQFKYYDKCFDDYYKENAEDMERKTVLFVTFSKGNYLYMQTALHRCSYKNMFWKYFGMDVLLKIWCIFSVYIPRNTFRGLLLYTINVNHSYATTIIVQNVTISDIRDATMSLTSLFWGSTWYSSQC